MIKIRNKIFDKNKIKDLFIYGFGQAINLLSPLIVMPYLISVCGEDGLGKIGVGFSFALILSGIVDYGSYIKGVKEISINRNDKQFLRFKLESIYLSKVIVLLIVLLIASAMLFLIPFFYKEKTLFFLSLMMVFGQLINPAWFFQATENFKWISAINIFSKIIYLCCIFLFINKKADYILANFFFGLGAVIANLVGFFYIARKYKLSIRNLSFRPVLAIIHDEFSFTLSQFFLSIYQFFPIMIISYFAGDFMAGQYRIIDQIIMIFKSALNIFFYFVYANICFEINKDLNKGLAVWKLNNGLFFIMISVLVAICFINAELIFTYFKINPLQINALSEYFRLGLVIPMLIAISLPLRQLMFAFDRNKTYIQITIIATIVNVLLLAFTTPKFGLTGALLSIIFIELIVIILYTLILRKFLSHPQNQINEN